MILDFKRTKIETNKKTTKTIFKKITPRRFFLVICGIIPNFGI